MNLKTNYKIKSIDDLPPGSIRVHLYNVSNVLRPRGTMQKESLGQSIYERLDSVYDSWTDPTYGDNPGSEVLLELLRKNLQEETENAWKEFLEKKINPCKTLG